MRLQIPNGVQVFIGSPAKAVSQDRIDRLSDMVMVAKGIDEAHLPQCFAMGIMAAPAQVLVVIGKSLEALAPALESIGEQLPKLVAQGEHLDVWPLAMSDGMVATVRGANCQIFTRPRRRWFS